MGAPIIVFSTLLLWCGLYRFFIWCKYPVMYKYLTWAWLMKTILLFYSNKINVLHTFSWTCGSYNLYICLDWLSSVNGVTSSIDHVHLMTKCINITRHTIQEDRWSEQIHLVIPNTHLFIYWLGLCIRLCSWVTSLKLRTLNATFLMWF